MSVKLRSKLPKGDANGVAPWETRLAEAGKPIPVVAYIEADAIETKVHDGEDPRVVKCSVVAIEAVDGATADAVTKVLQDVYTSRTGKATLPFEEEDGDEE